MGRGTVWLFRLVESVTSLFLGPMSPQHAPIDFCTISLFSSLGCSHLGPPNLPLRISDTDFFSCFLIVIEPLALGKVDRGKFGARFKTGRLEFALDCHKLKYIFTS